MPVATRSLLGRSSLWLVALAGSFTGSFVGERAAHADDVASKLGAYEVESRQLMAELPRPGQAAQAQGQRRLVDAQVAYALGDYETAAIGLFELAARPGADQETATFYLAETLYQKGDRGAARGYYKQVVARGSVASKYYQPSLLRLLEISIAQHDDTDVAETIAALDRIAPAQRVPSVPYVRGKLSYAQGKIDEALAFFVDVPKGSDVELPAAYYVATAYVAKARGTTSATAAPPATPPANATADLNRAIDLFTELSARKPRTSSDRRILELSQLALGRLYYERDQPSKSIDSYLMVDRHSALFHDALYEVAWVYVKAKQFDKALRALELLSASDPQSTKSPTVRILEGNLRIRKAQMIRASEIAGTLDNRDVDSPATEYDKAQAVFTDTHDAYYSSYVALGELKDRPADPAQYLMQIAGRSERVFQASAPLPEAAVQALRDEPSVQRVVAVESDLGEVQASLLETEALVARLEGVVDAKDANAAYPALASRRARLASIEADVLKIRGDLAEQQLKLVAAPAASGSRRQLLASFVAMPDPAHVAAEHLAASLTSYDVSEANASETEAALASTQAMAIALRLYRVPDSMPAAEKQEIATKLEAEMRAAEAIEAELASLRKQIQTGRDLAGVGDDTVAQARAARQQLAAAEDAEHQALVGLVGQSKDGGKSQQLSTLAARAAQLSAQLAQSEAQIDGVVAQGLVEARKALAEARSAVASYKTELAEREVETRALGGGVLAASFGKVHADLKSIIVRTDVGNVDVAWSQKSDVDDELKRLNLSRQRELKQLRDEFKDILDSGTQKPSSPRAAPPPSSLEKPEPPRHDAPLASGSPDQGAGEQRVAPGSDKPAQPAAPTVQPDAKKPAAKAATKSGGAR